MPVTCKSVQHSQDSFPTVYTRDASGACTVSSQCRLYKCGDESSPYGYQQYVGVPACTVDRNGSGCQSPADQMVQCFVNDCTCGGTSPCTSLQPYPYPFVYPYPLVPPGCPTSHRQLCMRENLPTPFCTPVRPGVQGLYDPPGCYVGNDPCNLLSSGANLAPTSPQCLSTCCPGSADAILPAPALLPYTYFDPRYPVIRPWWLYGGATP